MKRKSKLLHVMSIIFIIFSCLGILSGTVLILGYSAMSEILTSMGEKQLPIGYYTFALISSCIQLAAGITGVMYRSKKSVLIIGCVYCLTVLADLLYSISLIGFSASYALSLIVPALYMWGWYQSE